jgi:hypothetical protein
MCKGRAFAVRELLIFASVIVSMYDIEPIGGGSWAAASQKKIKLKKVGAVTHPAKAVRVWIRRREAPKKS